MQYSGWAIGRMGSRADQHYQIKPRHRTLVSCPKPTLHCTLYHIQSFHCTIKSYPNSTLHTVHCIISKPNLYTVHLHHIHVQTQPYTRYHIQFFHCTVYNCIISEQNLSQYTVYVLTSIQTKPTLNTFFISKPNLLHYRHIISNPNLDSGHFIRVSFLNG